MISRALPPDLPPTSETGWTHPSSPIAVLSRARRNYFCRYALSRRHSSSSSIRTGVLWYPARCWIENERRKPRDDTSPLKTRDAFGPPGTKPYVRRCYNRKHFV
ncbi:hypothetical protein PUN28_016595 [Cardiocondyla obscurior]|uniref:Uncharacterized protein n=1 Tax=Cardiocondyla obscurior TaxID=286306 RepID=A0AAW2EP29_9HYME